MLSTMIHLEVNENFKDYCPLILYPYSEKIAELKAYPSIVITDTIEDQVAELIKITNPSHVFSPEELRERVNVFFRENNKEDYGVWVYYPWRNALVRILDEADFVHLRTSRNKYKITPEEQEKLGKKRIGIIGLSVG